MKAISSLGQPAAAGSGPGIVHDFVRGRELIWVDTLQFLQKYGKTINSGP